MPIVLIMAPDGLTADDWVEAALESLADGGFAGLSFNRLAVQLDVQPGRHSSFFVDQRSLETAVLLRWEDRETTQVIEALEQLPNPAARLRALFHHTHPADGVLYIESAVQAVAHEPHVAAVLRRGAGRRLHFITDNLCLMGIDARYARQRALYAYQTWVGYVQLVRSLPDVMPGGVERERYVASMLATIESGWPTGGSPLT